ncbi:MAG: DHH family phosphoesterase, partial [Erysipelotrichaceae bacterium]|nr:DHH family phosphoesterase [Erysipelotrichaceae bacterium]
TMNVAKYVNEAITIDQIMTQSPITFKTSDFVQDVIEQMAKSRVRSYPVVNSKNEVVGKVNRYTLQGYKKKQFILVDHSSKVQAINNIDRAEVIEIIDHHNIGNIETDKAIMYRNMRVGCTCTIISLLYQENGLLPDERVSGLLLSAILSDTLNFKSATTTELDKITASWLAKRAGIESIDAYAEEMLGASVALKDSSPSEILNRDLKQYKIGKYNVAIGQTNYAHMKDVQALLPEFKENMELEQKQKGLDLLVMAFTHVMASGSFILFYGPLSYVMEGQLQTVFDEHYGYDERIISRKQQLVPLLSSILSEM